MSTTMNIRGRKTALKSHCYFLFTLSPVTSKKKKNCAVTVQNQPKTKFNQFHFLVTETLF